MIRVMTQTKKVKFIPPHPHPFLIWMVQRLSGLFAFWVGRFRLALEPADRKRLNALEQSRVVYLPNHPTYVDGIALFVLSAQIRQWFYYISAYESFQGLQGWCLSRLGAYSIRRGVADRTSIVATLKLMEQPQCKLVIFPEGGCSYQNDTVMPFREGAVELSLRSLQKLARGSDTVPDFYLVPVSLKYQQCQAMDQTIQRSLTRLENALALKPQSPDSYHRLRAIGGALLQRLEAEFGIDVKPVEPFSMPTIGHDWNQRIDYLKHTMLLTYEQQVGINPQPSLPLRERVYKIQALLEDRHEQLSKEMDIANKSKQLSDEQQDAFYEQLYRETLRLLNADAIYDGYVAENPTQERFLDTLTTLEREVFRIEVPRPKGMHIVRVKIGDIINLKDYLDRYCQHKALTVQQLTQQIQQAVQTGVLTLSGDDHPCEFF